MGSDIVGGGSGYGRNSCEVAGGGRLDERQTSSQRRDSGQQSSGVKVVNVEEVVKKGWSGEGRSRAGVSSMYRWTTKWSERGRVGEKMDEGRRVDRGGCSGSEVTQPHRISCCWAARSGDFFAFRSSEGRP